MKDDENQLGHRVTPADAFSWYQGLIRTLNLGGGCAACGRPFEATVDPDLAINWPIPSGTLSRPAWRHIALSATQGGPWDFYHIGCATRKFPLRICVLRSQGIQVEP